MKVSDKQMQEREIRKERIAELKKIKAILLKIVEAEKIEDVDRLKAVQLIIDIDAAIGKVEYNPISLIIAENRR